MTSLMQIQNFLGHKRLAVIGVSRNPRDFTRTMFDELRRRGYDAVPVNPAAPEIDGVPCYARVTDIDQPVEGALLMTSPAVTERAVRECHEAGIHDVWLYRGGGTGAVTAGALQFCQDNGMSVVPGECPFMFLPQTAWFHRFHGFCRRVVGSYPK